MIDLQIDFLSYQSDLKVKKINNEQHLWDTSRQKYLVATPEEFVRQLVIQHFIQTLNYPLSKIRTELGITVNNRIKRCDIAVFNNDFNPFLLVECKAPNVPISQAVFDQIAQYNLVLNADYLFITNGRNAYCCSIIHQEQSYHFLDYLPMYR